jgi:hypothetical protein
MEFSIAGTWRDGNGDPDATAIVLHCVAYDGRKGSFRLTKDTTFRLPHKTVQVLLEVLHPAEKVDLRVSLSPYVAAPEKTIVLDKRCPLGEMRMGRLSFPFGGRSDRAKT